MDTPKPGDRITTFTGDQGVVLRHNRLDKQSLIIWPDKWGRLPVNTNNGAGLSLHQSNLTVTDPAPTAGTPPRQPNQTLAATATGPAATRPRVQR